MSIRESFASAAAPATEKISTRQTRKARPAPFSIRLSGAERERLRDEAGGSPLGSYIKAKVLGTGPSRRRGSGLTVHDRQSLARALALLGASRISSNLNQLAHAANIGALAITPETEADLRKALLHVREVRALLMTALGLKAEGVP